MKIQYVAVPAGVLPEGVHGVVVEGEATVCILMSCGSTMEEVADDLTVAVNEHAQESWLHKAAFGWDKVLQYWGEADHDGRL